jgi:methoxymalonate biosynthesis protein
MTARQNGTAVGPRGATGTGLTWGSGGGVRTETVKCLIWDLDRTLWNGTLLEDSTVTVPDGIRAVVAKLDARGILQSVASHNDHDRAWARLQALGIAEFLIAPQIGWGSTPDAVLAIADRLGIAHRALAFIDDRPAGRQEVAAAVPEVRTYPAEAATLLPDLAEFSPAGVSEDAGHRRRIYRGEELRRAHEADFAGSDEEYLRSLELDLHVRPATEADLPGIEELSLRTGQLNATGVHYPAAALQAMLADGRHEVLVASLTDRFGPHGAIGTMLLARYPSTWHLALLATSGRVVQYGTGTVLLSWLIDQAALAGVHLTADFVPTGRNRLTELAYQLVGFAEEPCRCLRELPRARSWRRLHLVANPRQPPAATRVRAPDLAGADRPARLRAAGPRPAGLPAAGLGASRS